jgi:hypothetical protein
MTLHQKRLVQTKHSVGAADYDQYETSNKNKQMITFNFLVGWL